MPISTYTGMLTALGEQCHVEDLSQTILEDLFRAGEVQTYRALRVRAMEADLSVDISTNGGPLPLEFMGLKHAHLLVNGKVQPLDHLPPEQLLREYPLRTSHAQPAAIALDKSSFIFGPAPDQVYVLNGTFYVRLSALATANNSNWLTLNAPDVLMAAAKVEIFGFKEDTEQETKWNEKFQMLAGQVQQSEKRLQRSRQPRRTRPDMRYS